MATYDNDLRLKEITTGDEDGTWGTSTNTNLELIGEALGYGTQDCFATDANSTTTVADSASDPARAMYFKVTSSATLTATRELTIGPNTISRVMYIENATTGSQSITIKQGTGGTVTVANGRTSVVYLDGAGVGAAVVDAMANVDPGVTDTLAEVLAAGNTSGANDLVIDSGQVITTNTINETTAASGVTVDSLLIKDGGFTTAGTSTFAGQTISDLGTVTTADINGGSIDGAVIGGSSAAAITGTTITGTSFVSSGDMTFGDNDKAIFGAGSDLQIYHDGSNSYISDVGTGDLIVQGSNAIRLRSSTGENMGTFTANGAASLQYDNSTKLATTATGIDVTGTVVSDAIQVDTDSGITLKDVGDSRTLTFKIDAGTGRYQASGSSDHLFTTTDSNLARFYIANNGDISFYEDTGTTPKFFWDASAESLGIGTSSPTVPLDVYHPTNSRILASTSNTGASQLCFGDDADDYVGRIYYDHNGNSMRFHTNAAERMRIDSSGNVGIGTTSPAYKLSVHADAVGTTYPLKIENSNTTSGNGVALLFTHRAHGGDNQGSIEYVGAGANNTNSMVFKTEANGVNGMAERMRIDSSGNLLVGATSSIGYKFEVTATTDVAQFIANSAGASGAQIQLFHDSASPANDDVTSLINFAGRDSGANSTIYSRISGISTNVTNTSESGAIAFSTRNSGTFAERMRIDSSGNLLVGTTNAIDVASGSSDGATIESSGQINASINGGFSLGLRRRSNDGAVASFHRDTTQVGTISVTTSATAYNTSSDQRLKENIADADDAGSKVDAIQVRQFDWKADGSHQDYGMVAQELVTVAPEAVHQPEDPEEMMAVDYSKLVPMLVKEIQSLRARVAQLEGGQ